LHHCTAEDLLLTGGGLQVLVVSVFRVMASGWKNQAKIAIQRRRLTDGAVVGKDISIEHRGLLNGRPFRVGARLRDQGGLLIGGDFNTGPNAGNKPAGYFAHAVSLAAGQTLWLSVQTPWMRFGGVVPTADGGALLAGSPIAKTGARPMKLVRLNGAGKLLWQSAGADDDFLVTAAERFGAHFLVSGRELGGNQDRLGLRLIDGLGKTIWARKYGPQSGLLSAAMGPTVAKVSGGWATAAAVTTVQATVAHVVRTDPWGRPDCASSGVCMAKKAADCVDKNPCTADLCDGKGGCTYTPLSDGLACAAGKICKQGVCQ
jgi:hypothetical protein